MSSIRLLPVALAAALLAAPALAVEGLAPTVTAAPVDPAAIAAPVAVTAGAVIARVDGVPIHADELAGEVDALLPLESYHDAVKPEKLADLQRKAFGQLVRKRLVVAEARRLGTTPDAAYVEMRYGQIRGRFRTEAEFLRSLAAARLSVETVRRELCDESLYAQMLKRQVDAVVVDDAAARAFYDESPDRFQRPARYRLRHILLRADPSHPRAKWLEVRKRALAIRARAAAGEDFAALAREASEDPHREKGGDIGLIHAGTLEESIEAAVERLATGGVTDVIETIYGYHILRLEERLPSERVPFDQVRDPLKRDLLVQRRDEGCALFFASLRASARVEVLREGLE